MKNDRGGGEENQQKIDCESRDIVTNFVATRPRLEIIYYWPRERRDCGGGVSFIVPSSALPAIIFRAPHKLSTISWLFLVRKKRCDNGNYNRRLNLLVATCPSTYIIYLSPSTISVADLVPWWAEVAAVGVS